MPEVHGTCVYVSGMGVMLLGPSGSGKSDLALRLIDHGGGADALVADDRVTVEPSEGRLTGSAPNAICGRLEVRGVGVLSVPYLERAHIGLAVTLSPDRGERIPDFDRQVCEIAGIAVPNLMLDAFEASAPAKIRAMVQAVTTGTFANHVPSKADG